MICRLCLILFAAGMLWLPASVVAQQDQAGVTIHVVQRGENLFRIALRYGMTTEELAQLNGIIDPGNIQVGQRLLVPATTVSEAKPQAHVVQAGETLRSIADYYGKSVDELAALNDITNINMLYVGQVLSITPQQTAVPTPTDTPAPSVATLVESQPEFTTSVFHTVQPGETLFRIATQYGLTVNDLARANGINDPTLIYTGQQLVIPGVEPPRLALDLPDPVTGLDIAPLVFATGKTGRISLTTALPTTLTSAFLEHTYTAGLEQNNTLHTFFVGIPLFTEVGIYPLDLTVADGSGGVTTFTVNIQIVSGGYGSQNITLPAEKADLLDPAIDNNELALLQNLTSTFNPERYFSGPMGLPAAATMNSPFGTLRSYNGGAFDRFHSGVDFAGAPGTPVLAPAAGRVVMADTLNIRGVATIIDHGWGVYTTYSHQSERYVQLGEFVSAGQVIGTVGASGRATGAHLHWEVWVNGVPVDPLQWVSQSFS